jgi:DUF4097 and DUF4098 domain-containing protein YvlB
VATPQTQPHPPKPPDRPRRRRSIFPALLLILLGLIFLLHRWDPSLSIGHIARIYWPLLIVAWGVAKLIDHLAAQNSGQLRAPLLSPGEALLLIILAAILFIFGVSDWFHERVPWLRVEIPSIHDSYSRSRPGAPQLIPAGAHVTIETDLGGITVHGTGSNELVAGANESANGESESDADARMKNVTIAIERTANGYAVHPVRQRDFSGTVEVDLDVQLPSSASVTLRTSHGDIGVSGVGGAVDARTGGGDIEIHNVGGDVAAQTEKGDVRIAEAGGNVTLNGRGDDVEISDVKGNATLDGAFVGDTVFRKIAGTARVISPWSQLSVAQLTGKLEMDSGDLTVSDAAGAANLQTHDKDIDAENIAGQVDIRNSHGSIKLTCSVPPRDPINITNEAGDVELLLPSRSTFQIAAYSRSGQAESEFEGPSLRTTGDEKDGRLDGQYGGNSATAGPKITINTSYGTISLRKN